MTKKNVILFVGFVAAFLTTSLFYKVFVVPRLPEVNSVPVIWWILCGSPIVAIGIYAGWTAKHIISVFPLSFMGTIGYVMALQFTGQGFHDIEPGTSGHFMQLIASGGTVLVFLVFVIGVGRLSLTFYRRRVTS